MENKIEYKHVLSKKFKILPIFSEKTNAYQVKMLLFKKEFFKYKEIDLILYNFNTDYVYQSNDFIDKNSRIVYVRIIHSTPLLSLETVNFYQKNIKNRFKLKGQLNTTQIYFESLSKNNHLDSQKSVLNSQKQQNTIYNPPKGLPKSLWLISGSEHLIKTRVEIDSKKYTHREYFLDDTRNNPKELNHSKLLPKHLTCPFCLGVIKDAVLIPCCGYFNCCNSCILYKLYNNYKIKCPLNNCNSMRSLQYITPNFVIRQEIQDLKLS